MDREQCCIQLKKNNYMIINTSKTKFRCCAVCDIKCLKKCLFCGLVFYCEKSHQLDDWKRHKELCKKVKEQNLNK